MTHFDDNAALQSITFRLADSLPREMLVQLEQELEKAPEGTREIQRRKQIEDWLDTGMGCCALQHPEMAETMQNALLHFHRVKYHILAWCIMPNHVHVLIRQAAPLPKIVNSWKTFTARWALAHNARLGLGIPGKRFWMREYWDRYIRNEEHFCKAVEYIHQNPVKAGLCKQARDWEWSSAHPDNDNRQSVTCCYF